MTPSDLARTVLLAPAGRDAGVACGVTTVRHLLAVSRSLRPRRSCTSLAYTVYTVVIVCAVTAVALWNLWEWVGSFLVEVARPYHLVWGTPVVALVFLAVFRYSTLQGLVSYSEADCLLLLGAPVPRREMVWRRLRRVILGTATAGVFVGVVAAVISGRASWGAAPLVEAGVVGAALGVILAAGAWHVQRVRSATTWVVRLTLPSLAVVALLAFAGWEGGTAHRAALWSGPWGWGLLPFAIDRLYGVMGILLLCILGAVAWESARRTADACPLELFFDRARLRTRVVSGLYAFDVRSILLAVRRQPSACRPLRLRPKPPAWPLLAPPWHGLLMLLASPLRLGFAMLLAVGGSLLLVFEPGRTGTVWTGAFFFYLAAALLLEPLRLEVDSPATSRVLLPWRFARVLSMHCLLPTVLLVGTACLASVVAWATGDVSGSTVLRSALLGLPLTFLVVLAAALSARRGGRLPLNILLLTAGDTVGVSVIAIASWVVGWAVLGIAVLGTCGRLLAGQAPMLSRVLPAAAGAAALALILWILLLRTKE